MSFMLSWPKQFPSTGVDIENQNINFRDWAEMLDTTVIWGNFKFQKSIKVAQFKF